MMNEKKRTEYVNLFEENESLKTKINDEGIGCIHTFPSKTKVAQSIADGKGLTEAHWNSSELCFNNEKC